MLYLYSSNYWKAILFLSVIIIDLPFCNCTFQSIHTKLLSLTTKILLSPISAFTERESCTLVISFFSSSTREQTASGGWLVNFTQISLSQTTFPLFLRLSVQLRHSLAGGEAKWESFANFSFFHKAPPPLCCGGGEANTLLALHIVNTFQASCNLCSAASKREWTYLM